MEIRYKRTYIPGRGKRYTAGEIQGMLGYAVEVAEPRVPLTEGKLAPGEICVMLFAISPEEYAWKDSEPRQLDGFVQKLCKTIPADRILGWRICDLKGTTLQKAVQLQTGESIDGGAFAERMKEKIKRAVAGPIDGAILESRRLQNLCADKNAPEGVKQDWQAAREKLGKALLGLEKLYVVNDLLTGGRWPALGFDGRVEVFTTRERAERLKPQVTAAHAGVETWAVRELSASEIEAYLRRCGQDGLGGLRVDNGFAAAELFLKDFMPDTEAVNSALRGFMIREIEFGMRMNRMKEKGAPEKNVHGALEGMLTFRNFAWREIGNATLYAVCADGIHEKCIMLGQKDGGEKMMGVFTDSIRAAAFAERLEGNPVPVAMGFDEIALRAQVCDGLLVDVGGIGYRLPKAGFEKVKELRGKPPVVVRVQQPAAEVPADEAPAAQPRVQTDLGSLPNPDDFIPRKTEVPAAQPAEQAAPVAENPAETPAKKSFFRKLFGKRDDA